MQNWCSKVLHGAIMTNQNRRTRVILKTSIRDQGDRLIGRRQTRKFVPLRGSEIPQYKTQLPLR